MQNKGTIRFVALLLGLACLYQLSFTVVTRIQESKAKDYAEVAVRQYEQTDEYDAVDEHDKKFASDMRYNEREKYYLDSVSVEKVFFSFTYKECKEKELNLGLDLRGGMNVMLEVSVVDIVKAMANQNASPQFGEALAIAAQKYNTSGGDFVSLLGEAWNQMAPGRLLSDEFSYELQYVRKAGGQLSNSEVLTILREDSESAIANSFNVLRNRIDKFGVTQPNIQRLANSGRILVELPGIKEPDRVRKLLQGTASLEFWTTYENSELYSVLTEANRLVKEMQLAEHAKDTTQVKDTNAIAAAGDTSSLAALVQQNDSLSTDSQNAERDPLFYLLSPSYDFNSNSLVPGACIGHAVQRAGKVLP
jgi:SecD/SecF fusion protein